MNKSLAFIGAICLVLGGLVGFYLHSSPEQTFQAAGDTASSAKIAQVVMDLTTTTPTTVGGACKLYNSDARDRIINSVSYFLQDLGSFGGATGGVASTTWQMGTSTGVYVVPAAGSMVLNTTIATSTANGAVSGRLYVASTTPGLSATFVNRQWASGTCLNILTNATSSAASGYVRVDYSQGAN